MTPRKRMGRPKGPPKNPILTDADIASIRGRHAALHAAAIQRQVKRRAAHRVQRRANFLQQRAAELNAVLALAAGGPVPPGVIMTSWQP